MPQDVIKRVKKLEYRTKHLVEGLLQGAYHSVFKGRGIEFSEVREYLPGDDVRAIDWNVTARLDAPYVKEFIEERDLSVYLVYDMSASGAFGQRRAKQDVAVEMAASLLFAAARNNDNAGLVLFTDRVEKFVPARKGKKHMLRAIRDLLYHKPASKRTDVGVPLAFLSKVLKKKAIIFVISDFQSPDFQTPLRVLKNRHDVILIQLQDPVEVSLPDVGLIEVEDEETGEQLLVDTSDPAVREAYHHEMSARDEAFKRASQKLKVDRILVNTAEPFDRPLRKFFRMREVRRW